MSDSERKYATVQHPTIEALVHGLYKYIHRKDAVARLENIRSNFVMSKESPASMNDAPVALFWIKGYAVNEAEEKQGYTGHFCRMEITTTSKGHFTLAASKVETPLAKHPQKKRQPSTHPNWGHPVMRSVKKGKIYPTLEAAAAELELLHLEYPEVSIPGVNKLYLIIYEKREGIKQPTRKVALELAAKDAGFTILCKDNEKSTAKPASKQPPGISDAPKSEAQVLAEHNIACLPPGQKKEAAKPVGGFSAQELLRKKKRAMRRKKSDPRVSKKIADNPHES